MKFINYNANPKYKKTGDCVIRAICTALNDSWEDTYRGMLDVALRKGYAISSKDNYECYLKERGILKQKMPRKFDRTRYTVEEFADRLAKPNMTYIVTVANHLTVIINNDLYDLWNAGRKCVGNYWEVPTKAVPELTAKNHKE